MIRKPIRALRAAWWALFHADDLTMLKYSLNNEDVGWPGMPLEAMIRFRQWEAERFLNSLPID